MIFPSLTLETTLQIDDKTRLDASLSFATTGETITNIEIEPEVGVGFISVFNIDKEKWFLDYAYELEGIKTITVRVTTDMGTRDKIYSTDVLSATDDALLSSDSDLYPYEPDIARYLPVGKSSFLYAHRAAQTKILGYLDEQRIYKNNFDRYTKQDLIGITDPDFKEQFRLWSLFQTLLIIFEANQINVGDIYQEKREQYENEMRQHRNRSSLRLDQDGDGVLDETPYNVRSTMMVRR